MPSPSGGQGDSPDDQFKRSRLPGSGGGQEQSILGQLRRELYAREESADFKRRQEELSRLGRRPTAAVEPDQEPAATLADTMALRRKRHRQIIRWLLIGLLVVTVFAGGITTTVWYRLGRQVTKEQIGLTITAPEHLIAGEEISYVIAYQNNSRVAWENVEISFNPPDGFRYRSSQPEVSPAGRQYVRRIGRLEAGQQDQIQITGQLLGEQNAALVASSEIDITPENFPSGQFARSATVATTISSVPLEVAVEAASDAAHGERLRAILRVRNVSSQRIEGAYVKVTAPPGIQLATEDPEFSRDFSTINSWWEVPPLEPLADVAYTLVAYVEGQAGERRTFEFEAGIRDGDRQYVQRTVAHVVTISASELSVQQVFNGTVEPQTVAAGQKVVAAVKYKNVGTVGLKNVIVQVQFDGIGLDAASLQLDAGAYDPLTRRITWTSATVPELTTVQPQQEGEIEYTFAILPIAKFPADEAGGKNMMLAATATVDSPDLPAPVGQDTKVASDRAVLLIGTELTLEATAFYDDGRLGINSTGPLPPQVGQQTTYTVRLRVGSTFNDVGNLVVTAVLPDGVRYTNHTYKTIGEVQFDDRSGQVVWLIPLLAGLTGRAQPLHELDFQVAIVPAENQRGEVIPFLNRLVAEGGDLFTDQAVTTSFTTYPTTETANKEKGKVQ